MIKITKDLKQIPKILQKENRKTAFEDNINALDYVDKNDRYRVASVQKSLRDIYNLKCGYCEKGLLDASKPIEHYRPKRGGYYWLAYSWDNLLLSCTECNSAKGDKFPLKKTKVNYANEEFKDIHTLSKVYDKIEEPYLINPENENIMDKLRFDKKGQIFSDDERVKKTIEICSLDRKSLSQLRETIFIDFVEDMEGHYQYYKLKKDATRFIPTVQNFIKETKKENSFFAFRSFILDNIELFFEDRLLVNIIQKIKNR